MDPEPPSPFPSLDSWAAEELEALERAHLRRRTRPYAGPQGAALRDAAGRELVNFSSNDYLGLANYPALVEAARAALAEHGLGAGAARLVCGTLGPHAALEERLAAFKGTAAALAFSSGYAAAVGTIPSIAGSGDVVILDKLCHASLIDGARLSGATLRVFPHNHTGKLAQHLAWARAKMPGARVLVVVESVYSMDGDRAPLAEIVRLKDEAGAWLLVDEAHGLGVLGRGGRGLAEELGVGGRVELQMGTFSKALGVSGGYLCGSRAAIDLLVNRARSFIFSTAPPPALAAAIAAGIDLLDSGEGAELRGKLWRNINVLAAILPGNVAAESAILPWIVGEEARALALAEELRERGFLVPAIRYPTVGKGQARLRFTASAAHSEGDIAGLGAVLAELSQK
jgi:8-amino-7-oxononanoate synthase